MLKRIAVAALVTCFLVPTALAGGPDQKALNAQYKREHRIGCLGLVMYVAGALVCGTGHADAGKAMMDVGKTSSKLVQSSREDREKREKLAHALNQQKQGQGPPPDKKTLQKQRDREANKRIVTQRPPRTLPRDTGHKAKAETAKNRQAGKRR